MMMMMMTSHHYRVKNRKKNWTFWRRSLTEIETSR